MPDLEVPACLKDIEETLEVTVQVCVWIGDGIPYTRLCGEVHHSIEALFREQSVHGGLVADIKLYEPAG